MRTRNGITLMEVILALAIFVGSLVVISQLVRYGTQAVERARLETTASLLAASKTSEIASGIIPVADSAGRFAEQPAWQWHLSATDGPVAGLQHVQVTVSPSPDGELSRLAGGFHFTLDRWLLVDRDDGPSNTPSRNAASGSSP